jgi:hypothetical protein
MKECNICLRWIILHTSELPIGADINKRCKQMLQLVITDVQYNPAEVFKLLLNTAQFEFNLKEVCFFIRNVFFSLNFFYNRLLVYY